MADKLKLTRQQLARMAKQHAGSLRAAGVEWLPAAKTLPLFPEEENPAPVPQTTGTPTDLLGAMEPDRPAAAAAGASGPSLEARRQALAVLAGKVAGCTRCPDLAATRTQTVFGVGRPGVDVCFVGEAPGADEDAQGEPFVGAAGQLLNKIIAACRMKREDVFICNILRCRPPGNRTPLPDEIAHCREWLEKTLELVQPKFICALGGCAAQSLLQTTQPLGKLRGRFHDFRGIPVMVTYHPAYLLPHRNPHKKKDVWEDMKMLMARLGRPVV